MKRAARVLAGLLLLLAYHNVWAQKPTVEKAPAWVTQHELDLSHRSLDRYAESGYVDQAYEKQVNLSQQATYNRIAIRILSDAGVQNQSEVSMEFDPSFQKLAIHHIVIRRDGKVINQLNLGKIKVIQQETEREDFLYNGTKTALLLLEDVRKGDVIDYSFTCYGFNPVFNGSYSDFFTLKFSVPVYRLYYKLITPEGKKVTLENDKTSIKPTVKKVGGESISEWTLEDVEPEWLDESPPTWYDPYPCIMVSTWESWKQVSEWTAGLYPFDLQLSPGLREKIEQIKTENKSLQKRVLAALRFVQDEVRYYGIEMGAHSHKPHHPNVTFAQRFGDCKDKAYLLCIMLRQLDVYAEPVLVNTSYKKTIVNWLPSPQNFDHVTVRAIINGKSLWFDPTISYQRGNLENIFYPDYQYGLAVNNNTTGLTFIPAHRNSEVWIKDSLFIRNFSGKAKLVVETRYSGGTADGVRAEFEKNSIYEMQAEYKEFFLSYFDQVTSDSITYTDQEDGTFVTREYYSIAGLWSFKKDKKEMSVSPFMINSVMEKFTDASRSDPYALRFPLKYRETIYIELPQDWNESSSSKVITNRNFKFKSSYTIDGNVAVLEYEYENLKDHVGPFEADEYIEDFRQMKDEAGFGIVWDTRLAQFESSNPISTGSFGSWRDYYNLSYLALGLFVAGTYFVRRRRKAVRD
jgi:hypothetical protein